MIRTAACPDSPCPLSAKREMTEYEEAAARDPVEIRNFLRRQ